MLFVKEKQSNQLPPKQPLSSLNPSKVKICIFLSSPPARALLLLCSVPRDGPCTAVFCSLEETVPGITKLSEVWQGLGFLAPTQAVNSQKHGKERGKGKIDGAVS